ncbi:hypothetical protein AXF42_Ash002884 [Apostasia shenzhenica]|uniref:Uncharacterized protein n=1 Tax=Apostasia shenzhenica TaxID=1088818 RepID=A0A2I0A7K7_9ASPA|nr:hypothetical protein AXF42_Ash002884 [Apostasia shenzhenica]
MVLKTFPLYANASIKFLLAFTDIHTGDSRDLLGAITNHSLVTKSKSFHLDLSHLETPEDAESVNDCWRMESMSLR